MTILIPEGTYDATLVEADHGITNYKKTPFIRLRLITKEPIETNIETEHGIISEIEKAILLVNIFGSIDHVFAWRKLLNENFRVKVRHRLGPEGKTLYIDARIIGCDQATKAETKPSYDRVKFITRGIIE